MFILPPFLSLTARKKGRLARLSAFLFYIENFTKKTTKKLPKNLFEPNIC